MPHNHKPTHPTPSPDHANNATPANAAAPNAAPANAAAPNAASAHATRANESTRNDLPEHSASGNDASNTAPTPPPNNQRPNNQLPNNQLPNIELTFLLGMAFQLLLGEFTSRVAEAGYPDLRPVHGMAFQVLRVHGATSSELAERLGVTKQAAGQIVDDLEERGYVRRQPHPAGGRRKLVVLTDAAHQHLAVAGRILHAVEAEAAQTTGDQDLARLRAELSHLIRALHPDDPLPPLRPVW